MAACPRCARDVEPSFRFCPWCAAPQRRKVVEFFRAHPRDAGKALRVSRYLGPAGEDRHVRFSVWSEKGVAEAAVSIDEVEAGRLRRFLGRLDRPSARPRGSRRAAARREA